MLTALTNPKDAHSMSHALPIPPNNTERRPLSYNLVVEIAPLTQLTQIHDQNTFFSLITTCRSFRDIFVPFLRHRFLLHLNKIPTSKLRRKFLPTGLRHTRKLEVCLDENEFWGRFADGRIGSTYKVKHNDLYASFVIRILEEMANLRSFRSDMSICFGLAMD